MNLYQEYLGGGGVSQQKIFGSSLEDIKQKAIKAGINPVNLQEAQQFQNGSWTPFTQGQTATYKGSDGIPEQSFAGTNQEITQQATAAGINPSNLFSGLDKFVPEQGDNIQVDKGTESLLQGGQSDWFKTFQNAYVSGQNTIQQSIANLMKQQADITEEQRQGYQGDIDKATEGLEEAEAKPTGEELGSELSEKYKLQEKIDALGEIGNQLAQLQGAYDTSIAETEMSGITVGQSRGELSRKYKEYASKATVLQARGAVINEQYNLVSDLVKQYYTSAETERTAEIKRYQNLLDVATQAKLALTGDDKNMITNQINLLLGEQTKQEDNKDKIMALMIDPSTAEAFFNSGASLDDSYETILEKMSPYMSAYAQEKRTGADTELELTEDAEGNPLVFNPITGELTSPTTTTDSRTDRNFNPIAISTARTEWQDVLKEGGFDFSVESGADFGEGLSTLNFGSAENGIEASKFILGKEIQDNSGNDISPFYWYKNHTGQDALDEYGIESPEEFESLSDDIKDSIVKDIYSNEQPGGDLFGKQLDVEEEKKDLRNKILTLSAGQQEGAFSSVASFKNAKDLLDLLDTGVKTGLIQGTETAGIELFGIPLIPGKQQLGTSSKEENEFIAASTAFAANFIKSISGVAVSAQEFRRLSKALPSIKNQENVNRDNLKMLTDTIKNKYELQLGINFDDYPNAIPSLKGDEESSGESSGNIFNNLLNQYGK